MVTLEEIEWAVRSHPDPVVTVGDVVERLEADVSDTHVRQQMKILEASGTLAKKQTGARALAFWHTDRVSGPETRPADHPDQSDLSDAADSGGAHKPAGSYETDVALVADIDLPGEGEKLISRQQSLQEVLRELDMAGDMTAKEIRELVYPGYPAEYETANSWWKNFVGPALQELAERDRVELVDRARGRWASREDSS